MAAAVVAGAAGAVEGPGAGAREAPGVGVQERLGGAEVVAEEGEAGVRIGSLCEVVGAYNNNYACRFTSNVIHIEDHLCPFLRASVKLCHALSVLLHF